MKYWQVNLLFFLFVGGFACFGTYAIYKYDYYLGTHRGPFYDYYMAKGHWGNYFARKTLGFGCIVAETSAESVCDGYVRLIDYSHH